jgi:tetratricopeptide (TPR) repeat protein
MSDFSSLHSKTYNNFKEIDLYSYKLIVDFYAKHEEEIQRLKFHEYFELHLAYIEALLETGFFQNLLKVCDETIEAVIQNNIQYYQGEDIYRKLLLHKSAAHYNLLEYHKAEFILKELIKINPKDEHAIRFFRKSQLHRPVSYVQNTRNVSLLLFLFTAMVICFEMAYFGFGKPQTEMAMIIEVARNIVFLSGWLVLILGDGIFRWKTFKTTTEFVKTIQLQKGQKSEIPVFSKE